jgi:RNA polymerase sigma factor, sigma-70 family
MKLDKFKDAILPLKDKLFRLAFSITGNKEDAEDVVQDTMLHVWKKRGEWHTIKNLEGYCMRSVRNIALDKISLKDNNMTVLPDHYEVADIAGITEQLEKTEQLNIIHKLIDRLPEKQRTIVRLRDVEGLSYKEIAEIMEVKEEQVKITLFRTRQKLKEHFRLINNYGIKRN